MAEVIHLGTSPSDGYRGAVVHDLRPLNFFKK